MKIEIVPNTRVETNETRTGRLRERTVTTYDVVADGSLVHEFERKRDAVECVRRMNESER